MRLDASYVDWKKELSIWQTLTDLSDKKQGPVSLLSLSGKSREAALELPTNDICSDDGITQIISKLDQIFLQDTDQLAFTAYEKFESLSRGADVSMSNYLADFDLLYGQVKKYGMVLPEGVVAYRLLKSANLSPSEDKLARVTVYSLTYADMKECLKKIAGQSELSRTRTGIVSVKKKIMNHN